MNFRHASRQDSDHPIIGSDNAHQNEAKHPRCCRHLELLRLRRRICHQHNPTKASEDPNQFYPQKLLIVDKKAEQCSPKRLGILHDLDRPKGQQRNREDVSPLREKLHR